MFRVERDVTLIYQKHYLQSLNNYYNNRQLQQNNIFTYPYKSMMYTKIEILLTELIDYYYLSNNYKIHIYNILAVAIKNGRLDCLVSCYLNFSILTSKKAICRKQNLSRLSRNVSMSYLIITIISKDDLYFFFAILTLIRLIKKKENIN